jgi:hypothetical protein
MSLVIFITYNRVKLDNPVIQPLVAAGRETRWTIFMKLPVNILLQVAEAHTFTNAGDLDNIVHAIYATPNTASRKQDRRLSGDAHLSFDHTWGKIHVWVDKTHRNSLIIFWVASDLISNGEDVYHPDAGHDGLKYTLFF